MCREVGAIIPALWTSKSKSQEAWECCGMPAIWIDSLSQSVLTSVLHLPTCLFSIALGQDPQKQIVRQGFMWKWFISKKKRKRKWFIRKYSQEKSIGKPWRWLSQARQPKPLRRKLHSVLGRGWVVLENSIDRWDSKHGLGPIASPITKELVGNAESQPWHRVSASDLQVSWRPSLQETITPDLDHTSELIHEHTREPEYLHTLHLSLVKGCSSRRCKFQGPSSFHVVHADSTGRGEPMDRG